MNYTKLVLTDTWGAYAVHAILGFPESWSANKKLAAFGIDFIHAEMELCFAADFARNDAGPAEEMI
jgi:hypothetical protein